MRFTKMHGTGNDYVYVNCFEEPAPAEPAGLAVALSRRHTGIGADGLILIHPSDVADARMQMFNADGSEGEMCGNGIRCVGKLLYERGVVGKPELRIETRSGTRALELHVDRGTVIAVRVNMGPPILEGRAIPTLLPGDPPIDVQLDLPAGVVSAAERSVSVTCLSMGNPHCVLFLDDSSPFGEPFSGNWIDELGPAIEHHRMFPQRVNVEFAEVLSPTEISMRVWERGSGQTQACGTGACAACVAGGLSDRTERSVLVHLPGGDLEIEWASHGDVYLTGPAVEVFRGDWPCDKFD